MHPIKTSKGLCFDIDGREISNSEARSILVKCGYKQKYIKPINYILVVILSILGISISLHAPVVFFVVIAVLFVYGHEYGKKKNVLFWKIKKVSTYTNDRRYKSGMRHTGFINEKVKIKIGCTENEANLYKKKGNAYMIISVLVFALSLIYNWTYIYFIAPC